MPYVVSNSSITFFEIIYYNVIELFKKMLGSVHLKTYHAPLNLVQPGRNRPMVYTVHCNGLFLSIYGFN